MNTNKIINSFSSWKNEHLKYKKILIIAIFFVILSNTINFYAGTYVSKLKVESVPDLILNNFGPYDLNFLFGFGFIIILTVTYLYPFLFEVKLFHKVLFQTSILITIRAFFICLTHLQIPSDATQVHFPIIFGNFLFQNDLFFSGHVALTFLGFFIFEKKQIKIFFLISSILMGFVVLGMHQHYSIDVFAAFFITYTSFKIGEYIIKIIKKNNNLN